MLISALLVTLLLSTSESPNAFAECDLATLQITGTCPNDGNEVIIDASHEQPGSPGHSDHPPGRPIGNDEQDSDPVPKPIDVDLVECLADWNSYIRCFVRAETEPDEEQEDVVEIPAVTISDVARFAPSGSPIAGEPDNVGVVGLPTNFVATASEHTVGGELFGFPVTVRFTPSGYDFDYGDGVTSSTTTGGQSWEALGQAQFTLTDTSHTYAGRGTYSAHVNIRYTAAVDFGIGWFPITGEVTATGAAQEVRIFEAHTALVAHTCQQNPASPGC